MYCERSGRGRDAAALNGYMQCRALAGGSAKEQTMAQQSWKSPPEMTIDIEKGYTAVVKTSEGDITIELFSKDAPKTVNNFVFLARQGYYSNVIFHRVIKGFMIQTGDPTGTGTGGPGYKFADEPVRRQYTKGTVAMAN